LSGHAPVQRLSPDGREQLDNAVFERLPLGPCRFARSGNTIGADRVIFDGRAPSGATLLKWAARDNDQTMLYGAELHVNVAR
jgi:hypothetical protein